MANQKKKKPRTSTKKTNSSSKSRKKTSTAKANNNKTQKLKANRKPSKTARDRDLDLHKEHGMDMREDLQFILSFGVMILLFLSNFGLCGNAGKIMSGFLFGLFGCVQYVMPIAFFLAITFLMCNEYSPLAIKKCLAGFIVLMMISGYVQLIFQGSETDVFELFRVAVKNPMTGGIIGGGFSCLLCQWFSPLAACLIMFCISLLAVIMLTQKSVHGFWKRCLKNLGDYRRDRSAAQSAQNKKETKRHKSVQDRDREKKCEKKVKELEERQQANRRAAAEKGEKTKAFRVPTFKSSDEIRRKDAVKELHPEIYPFTQEDGKSQAFEQELDYSAFALNSGMSEEEFVEDMRKSDSVEDLPQKVKDVVLSITRKGAKEIGNLVHPPMEEEDFEDGDDVFDIEIPVAEEDLPREEDIPMEEEIPDVDIPMEERIPVVEETPMEEKISAKQDIIIHKEEKGADAPESPDVSESQASREVRGFRTKKAEGEDYIFPPTSLLSKGTDYGPGDYDQVLKDTAIKLQVTLESFGVNVKITDISFGPTVTRYEMVPEQGTKVSKIVSLTDDIKLNLAAEDIRIEAPIPGKSAIGIEVPNKETLTVHFRELIESKKYQKFKSRLAFAVGKDIGGQPVISDLGKMPHLLIAGATGSGKSVCINTLIMSILYKARPDQVKLIMIDPKMVELSIYKGIPHLLIPVVTDPKKASGALNWAVAEMTDRYNKFSTYGVRNLEGYNEKVRFLVESGEVDGEKLKPMPQIVIIIDELADLMMVAPGEVEDAIVRLSQLARAAGIHLVIATQRPSVNIITGLIKANVPSRIAFAVSSGVDSRTIIDMNGAEKLLGKGDMLFYPAGVSKPSRVQGAFISDDEIMAVVEFLKNNESLQVYDDKITEKIENKISNQESTQDRDEYFEDAARFILEKDKASIGMLQRMFKIGFNRAARIMDQLAEAGIVGPEEGTKPRKILMSPEQLEEYFEEYL